MRSDKAKKLEIFKTINAKYTDDQAEEKLEALQKAGLSLQEILILAMTL